MAGTDKKQPRYWINPNTRLCFPHFRIVWNKCTKAELLDFCSAKHERRMTYRTGSVCLHILYEEDFSVLHFLYSDDINFVNIRLQKWLRVSIGDAVMERARIILPKRLHELEEEMKVCVSQMEQLGKTVIKCPNCGTIYDEELGHSHERINNI